MISNYSEALQRWNGKPYYSLNQYLQEHFGEKIYKIALDGGFTCPNRDGSLGSRGCIFCSAGGSGEFSGARLSNGVSASRNIPANIHSQLEAGKQLISKKYTGRRFIAYFQAFTNTYAPVDYLEKLYMPVITHPETAVLSIATRPTVFRRMSSAF